MIQRPAENPALPGHDRPLVTFRVWTRLDLDAAADFEATPRNDHRPHYLDYQGPLSDNRGSVRRLARGLVLAFAAAPETLDLSLDWGSGPRRWLARCLPPPGTPHPGDPAPSEPSQPSIQTRWLFRLQT